MYRLLFSFVLIKCAICWKPYADPLSIPMPISDGESRIIRINMTIQWQYSMASLDRSKIVTIIDYDPNDQKWYERSSEEDASECYSRSAITNTSSLFNNLVQLHGLHKRIITINEQSPFDPIVVPLGAEVMLQVTNKLLTEAISIHIHGLDKRGLWYTDGVPFIQQCPIAVNSKYTYRFIADTPGTHWFHGHMQTDRGEGLLGAFVVTDLSRQSVIDSNNASIIPSRQYVALLQDVTLPSPSDSFFNEAWQSDKWSYGLDGNGTDCFSSPRSYDGTMVGGSVPLSAILVNSKGWYDQQMLLTEPWKLPLEIFQIKVNENILLRVINGGVAQQLMLAIEDHELTIVATDGSPIKPIVVHMLIIFPGERYDILIHGKSNITKNSYYIILETLEYYTPDFEIRQPFYGLAKLEYDQSSSNINESPADFKHIKCTASSNCVVLNCPFAIFPPNINYTCINVADLRSLDISPIDNSELFSDTGFDDTAAYEEHFINLHFGSYVNGWRFVLPANGMPYYHQNDENSVAKLCDPSKCPTTDVSPFDPDCQCFFHLNITYGNIVQLTFYNMGEANAAPGCTHSVHIHGTHYYLMKMGYGMYNLSGMLVANSADIPCGNGTTCNDLQWSNTSWLRGRIPEMNTIDPSLRDTVVLPAGAYVVIRFRANNPGWFYGHCHIMLHQLNGMAFGLRIGTNEQMPMPPDTFPHECGSTYEPPALNLTSDSTTVTQSTIATSTTPNRSSMTYYILQIELKVIMFALIFISFY